jgi:hypothetical protein
MFSSCAPISALVAGREDRRRQLRRVLQARRQLHAADRAGLLVLLPAAAGEVAADDRLDRQRPQALDEHRAAAQLRALVVARDDARGIVAGEVVRHDVRKAREPGERHLRQHAALAWDRLLHDDVERAQAIARDHQQAVVADRVVVAHLAARDQRQRRDRGLEKRRVAAGRGRSTHTTVCASSPCA